MESLPQDPVLRIEALQAAIGRLERVILEPPALEASEPVFLASIGWRSGSTLMQRILMTDPALMVWGEPLSHLLYVNRLTELLYGFTEIWPEGGHWISHLPKVDLTRDWVAHVAPDAGHLKGAYRAFIDRWLEVPAQAAGFQRWGVKQVRWSGEEAVALRWLYPNGRFVLMVRHPVNTYLSMKQAGFTPNERGFVLDWPDNWILDLDAFARHWNHLALSWSAILEPLGVRWVRYEDMMGGRIDLEGLGRSLGLSLAPEEALAVKAGGAFVPASISAEERDRINLLTAPGRGVFAYAE
jgi:hypothetical protein